eukprot:gnl/MRDRNA2_/MRDRNA2_107796_c0_seq1.p1 gnl/MRDRNA2_/MRDRNA2_107796_c0~~gnl/MRDRNA2_/MRDRNA2_107796_c0_seq1.p1  ORF type:complete len:659 (+),score=100.89 gnl/MRDRNA2_/MRDRNA2_107796_c0_seq1:128-1978(+)
MAHHVSYHEWSENEQKSLCALDMHLQKTKLCMYHLKGRCKHSKNCRFAHGSEELAQVPNLHKTRMCPNVLAKKPCNDLNCTFAHHENDLKKVNLCHKTVVCSWFLAGQCRNGTKCSFAHGEHELKRNARTLLQEQKLEPPNASKKFQDTPKTKTMHQQNDSMCVQSSRKSPEPFLQASREASEPFLQAPVDAPVSPCMPAGNSLFHEPCLFQSAEHLLPSAGLPSVPPPPPPPLPPLPSPPYDPPSPHGSSFINDMQLYVDQSSCSPQREMLGMPVNYMPIPSQPAMTQFDDIATSNGASLQFEYGPFIDMEQILSNGRSDKVNMAKCEKMDKTEITEPNKEMRSQTDKDKELLKQSSVVVCNFVSGLASKGNMLRSRSMGELRCHERVSDDSMYFNMPGFIIKNTFINSVNDVDIDRRVIDDTKRENIFEPIQASTLSTFEPLPASTHASSSSPDSAVRWSDHLIDSVSNGWREVDSSDATRYCSASGISTPEEGPPPYAGAAPGHGSWQQPLLNFHSNVPPPPPTAPPPLPADVNSGMVDCMGGPYHASTLKIYDLCQPDPMNSMAWFDPILPCIASTHSRGIVGPQVHHSGTQEHPRQAIGSRKGLRRHNPRQ